MRGKWTEGPWFRDCTDEVCATLEGGAVVVIAAFNPMAELNAEATEANACLGAAAPALYEALEALAAESKRLGPQLPYNAPTRAISEALEAAAAALAQARGEQP